MSVISPQTRRVWLCPECGKPMRRTGRKSSLCGESGKVVTPVLFVRVPKKRKAVKLKAMREAVSWLLATQDASDAVGQGIHREQIALLNDLLEEQ